MTVIPPFSIFSSYPLVLSHEDEDYCVQRLLKYQNSEDLRTLIDLALVCKGIIFSGNQIPILQITLQKEKPTEGESFKAGRMSP